MSDGLRSEPVEMMATLRAAIEGLNHSLQGGLLHRLDSPRPDGTFVTPPEEMPHERWCIPCYLLAHFDPALDLRETS